MTREIYQRLDSLLEQIQPIFRVEISDHITGHDGSTLAFSCSKLVRERSSVRSWRNLTPLQVRSCFCLEAGSLEKLGE